MHSQLNKPIWLLLTLCLIVLYTHTPILLKNALCNVIALLLNQYLLGFRFLILHCNCKSILTWLQLVNCMQHFHHSVMLLNVESTLAQWFCHWWILCLSACSFASVDKPDQAYFVFCLLFGLWACWRHVKLFTAFTLTLDGWISSNWWRAHQAHLCHAAFMPHLK